MTIEIGDDMPALREARLWADLHGHQTPDDRMLRAYGQALLAIVERDYRIEPKPPWEREPCLCGADLGPPWDTTPHGMGTPGCRYAP